MGLGRPWVGLWRLSNIDEAAAMPRPRANKARSEVVSTLGSTSCAALMIQKVKPWTAGLTG